MASTSQSDANSAALVPEVVATPAAIATRPAQNALTRARVDVVRKADDRLRRRAQRIVDAVPLAARLNDEGVPVDGTAVDERGVPVGWTAVRYNVAKDARRPLKSQPGYLATMTRVHESYVKAASQQPQAPQLNVDVQVFVHSEVRQYAVVDVTDVEQLR